MVLTSVSAFVKLSRSVRPTGVGHTSGCTNFGFVRLFRETRCPFASTRRSARGTSRRFFGSATLSSEGSPLPRESGTRRPLGSAAFVASAAAHTAGSQEQTDGSALGLTKRPSLRANGRKRLILRDAVGVSLAIRSLVARAARTATHPRASRNRGTSTRGATVTSVTVRLLRTLNQGREASCRRRFRSRGTGSWRWRGGGQAVLVRAVKTRGCAKPQCTFESASADSPVSFVWTGQVSPSGKGEGCAGPYRAVELRRR